METLFLLVAAHALCDFALQTDTMCRGKNRRRNPPGQEEDFFPPWYAWMSAHCLIHGGAVAFVTGFWALGALEAALHAWIDHSKCEGRIDFDQDQLLHLACKLGYVVLFV